MSSRKSLLSLLIFACILSTADDARAQSTRQERLFAVAAAQVFEIDTAPDTFGRILRSAPFTALVQQPVWGGRFLLGIDSTHQNLAVFDTRLFAGRVFPVMDTLIALDTHRPRVFLESYYLSFYQQTKILDLTTGVISLLPGSSSLRHAGRAAYAGLTDLLFRQRGRERQEGPLIVDAIEVATGTVVRSIDVGVDSWIYGMATDVAGTRLFVLALRCCDLQRRFQLSAFDVATGAAIARVDVADAYFATDDPFHALQLDEERNRLLVGTLSVFDASTLAHLGSTRGVTGGIPQGNVRWIPQPAFTGPRSPFFLYTTGMTGGRYAGEPSRCVGALLERRNASNGAVEAVVDIGAATTLTTRTGKYLTCSTYMVMATVPRPPQNFTGTVNGHQVTLSWIDPGNATHFDIEAGSAPGLANLLLRSLNGTTLIVDGVPSGRYYVRVRAINDVGRSVATEDIAVIVR